MIEKLIDRIKETGAPIVVGLDPMLKFVPEHIKKKAFAEHGETLEGAAAAIWEYNKEIIDHIYDLVPAVKPQIAMYEQFGISPFLKAKNSFGIGIRKNLCALVIVVAPFCGINSFYDNSV